MTSYLTSSPPILRLNHDILSSIFALNADIFETGHALLYTRLTSQVCRSWRNLMLSSPS
ncbi:hypothetical protein CPB84DRAFT_1763577 [Gymnopilus junonius]|uniref:F-box domain-containing protein n=1 Tax=Gymnopilus junonius TaxID=109634 RepID=A0A9P5NV67_GYMJU|nr:hypothetical protein CPB84DRAFT_1763577 [Gymnopilus junonius]